MSNTRTESSRRWKQFGWEMVAAPLPARRRDPMSIGRVLLEAVLVLGIIFCGLKAFGQDAPVVDAPVRMELNDGGMKVSVLGGMVTSLTGAADTANVKGSGWIEAEMPVGWARPYARVGITARPEETLDLTNVATFSTAEIGFGLERGVSLSRDSQGRVGLIAEGGFSSIISGEPSEMLSRYLMGGVKFSHIGGGEIAIGYGMDTSAGPFGWGQIIGYGTLPIPVSADVIVLTGDFTLNVQREPTGGVARDILKLGIMIDVGKAMAAIKEGSN